MADSKAGVLKEALRRLRSKTGEGDDAAAGVVKRSRLNKAEGQDYSGPRKSVGDEPGDTEDAMDELSKSSEEKREKRLRE